MGLLSKSRVIRIVPVLLCCLCQATMAAPQADPADDETAPALTDSAPLPAGAPADAPESPLELDDLEVSGTSLSFRQEFTLRMLRSSLGKPRSRKQEDKDDWVCWIQKPTGSSLGYLNCARNGDLWAREPAFALLGPTAPMAGYGTILRSSRPVNSAKLKQVLAQLEGPEGLDQEFVAMALQGRQPPRDIPSEQELEQFAEAYRAVTRLQARGRSESAQIRAIEDKGLSLEQYNHIAGLTETYRSIKEDIAARLE
jgi:hypothetical protein